MEGLVDSTTAELETVKIAKIIAPNKIVVKYNDTGSREALDILERCMNEEFENCVKLGQNGLCTPTLQMNIVYKDENGSCKRGQITKTDEDFVEIILSDYGEFITLQSSEFNRIKIIFNEWLFALEFNSALITVPGISPCRQLKIGDGTKKIPSVKWTTEAVVASRAWFKEDEGPFALRRYNGGKYTAIVNGDFYKVGQESSYASFFLEKNFADLHAQNFSSSILEYSIPMSTQVEFEQAVDKVLETVEEDKDIIANEKSDESPEEIEMVAEPSVESNQTVDLKEPFLKIDPSKTIDYYAAMLEMKCLELDSYKHRIERIQNIKENEDELS